MKKVTAVLFFLASVCAHAALPIPFTDAYHDGFNLTLWRNGHTDAELDQMLARLKQTGARNIQIPLWGCQSDLNSSDIGSCELVSREFTLRQVDRAIAQGFSVKIFPAMATKNWEWRGYFVPTDLDAWFENYTRWILDVAREARARGQADLVIGSEFNALFKHEDRWRKVAEAVRLEFQGPLILTVNWDDVNHGFWDAVDAIGLSAYFPLSRNSEPSQDELDGSWKKLKKNLLKISDRFKRPLYVNEVGYTNSNTTAKTPWNTPATDPRNDALQARCFEAFRKAWEGEKRLVRANVWSAGASFETGQEVSGDPLGRPAENVLKNFFETRDRKLGGQ